MITPTYKNVQAALFSLSPDVDREEWAKIAMAVKDGLSGDGLDLFDQWSQNGQTYNKDAVKDTWNSIKANGNITVGTLFYMAMQNGWQPDGDAEPETEQQRLKREADRKAKLEKAEKEKLAKQQQALDKAIILFNNAKPAQADHPYLVRKGIKPVQTLLELNATETTRILGYEPKSDGQPLTGRLLIAKVRIKGVTSTAELIDEQGRKSAIYGGAKSGGYYSVRPLPHEDNGDVFLIAEGVATVISAFEATQYQSLAALSASNLPKVAKSIRERYPNACLVILADIGNGQQYAEKAAQENNGVLALPNFADNQIKQFQTEYSTNPTDFNDLHKISGIKEVNKQIKFFCVKRKNTAQTAQNSLEANNTNDFSNSEQHSNSTRTAQTALNSTNSSAEQHKIILEELEEPVKKGIFVMENSEGKLYKAVESKAAKILARLLDSKDYAYDSNATSWHKYNGYAWTPLISSIDPESVIMQALYAGTEPVGFKMAYFTGVLSIMLRASLLSLPPEPVGKIPFKNGLLDIETKKLEQISKDKAAIWAIPHDYYESNHCPAFIQWLKIATEHDQEIIELIRAFINACLIGRADLQKFLQLLGPAGTGKSTFIRLLFAMLGSENCITTDLKNLEENKFETACIYGKRLTAITDSDKYGGSVNVLKALTGQDPVRNEKKNVQQSGTYTYEGMVLIASNEPLASTDYTSGLDRRRLVIKFEHRIKPEEKAIFLSMGGEDQLHKEIPAIINWALQLSTEQVTKLFMHPPKKSREAAFESLTAQNPIAEWISDNLIPELNARVFFGSCEESRSQSGVVTFADADIKLYPNYLRWCRQNKRESLGSRRFKHTVTDMLQTMGWEDAKEKPRDSSGQYLSNIRLKLDFEQTHDWENSQRGGI
jgi:putative DNA primase/helicase